MQTTGTHANTIHSGLIQFEYIVPENISQCFELLPSSESKDPDLPLSGMVTVRVQ